MIGHQAVGVTDPVVTSHDARERAQKRLAVASGKKHLLARIAAARQMIDRTGKF